jgi:ParE toxin of type II toxin-antitoxin system, parDE
VRSGSLTRPSARPLPRPSTAWPPIPGRQACGPLTGHRPYLRVRSGDYRVIYAVDDRARLVTIAAVGHRREVYRTLDLQGHSPGLAAEGRDHSAAQRSEDDR